jgi:hypothetical protein
VPPFPARAIENGMLTHFLSKETFAKRPFLSNFCVRLKF